MAVEHTIISQIEGYSGQGREVEHRAEVEETATAYLRGAAFTDPEVRSTIEAVLKSDAPEISGAGPSKQTVVAYRKATTVSDLSAALSSLLGRERMAEFLPRWSGAYEGIISGGLGDNYLEMMSGDSKAVGTLIDSTVVARKHLRDLAEGIRNPYPVNPLVIVDALR